MITDEEIEQLPEDPELAFVQFEEIVRKRLNAKIDDLNQDDYGGADVYYPNTSTRCWRRGERSKSAA